MFLNPSSALNLWSSIELMLKVIHPFSFNYQGCGGSCPDLRFSDHLLQLILGDTQRLPSQFKDLISPMCPESAPELPPSRICKEHLTQEAY